MDDFNAQVEATYNRLRGSGTKVVTYTEPFEATFVLRRVTGIDFATRELLLTLPSAKEEGDKPEKAEKPFVVHPELTDEEATAEAERVLASDPTMANQYYRGLLQAGVLRPKIWVEESPAPEGFLSIEDVGPFIVRLCKDVSEHSGFAAVGGRSDGSMKSDSDGNSGGV